MAQAGWQVTVHEAEETIGGGVRSAELVPGFVHDVCSAIHPLARGSPFFRDLELPVDWIEPPAAAAHPLDDGTAVVTERSLVETAEALGPDRTAYTRLLRPVVARWPDFEPVVLGPLPPPAVRVQPARREGGPLERPVARRAEFRYGTGAGALRRPRSAFDA